MIIEEPETPAALLRDVAARHRQHAAELQSWIAEKERDIAKAQGESADLIKRGAALEQAADQLDGVTS